MIELIKKYIERYRQFLTYSVGGIIASIIDFGLLYSLTEFVGLWYLASASIAVLLAATFNYLWQRNVVFNKSGQSMLGQAFRFIIISGIAILLNIALLYVAVDMLGLWYMLAKVIVTGIVLIWNFLGNKYYTFKMHLHDEQGQVETLETFKENYTK